MPRARAGPARTSAASRSSAGTSATTTGSRSRRSPKASWCGCGSSVTVPSDRHFVVLDDALPAGLEAVDLSLRTVGRPAGPGRGRLRGASRPDAAATATSLAVGLRQLGRRLVVAVRPPEMRDDRVVYVATRLWPGSYTATYVARATTPGTFVRPPAHAEEMYNPAVFGESDGGVFTVTAQGGDRDRRAGRDAARLWRSGSWRRPLGAVGRLARAPAAARAARARQRPAVVAARPLRLRAPHARAPPTAASAALGAAWRRWIPTSSRRSSRSRTAASTSTHGVDLARARRAPRWTNLRARPHRLGRLDDHDAARAAAPARSRAAGRGKARRSLWALRLERHLAKQAILEQYLNRVPLGQGAVGVEAGGGALLRRRRRRAEPRPGGAARRARPRAVERQSAGLSRARAGAAAIRRSTGSWRSGFAPPAAADAGRGASRCSSRRRAAPFLAPHFTTRVLALGRSEAAAPAQRHLAHVARPAAAARARGRGRATRSRRCATAARATPPPSCSTIATGEVLAWVGSPDFWADTAGQVDMVVSPRQPGSALKPFLYALAFDRGYTPASILPDIARRCTRPAPGRTARATTTAASTVRCAPARRWRARTTCRRSSWPSRLGVGSLLQILRGRGLRLARPQRRVTTGSASRSATATSRCSSWPTATARWRTAASGGPTAWQSAAPDRCAASPAAGSPARARPRSCSTSSSIRSRASRASASRRPLDFPFPVAAKTGTSRHFTDNWAVGATGGFTVAVWVGNFSGRPMDGVSGVSGAGPAAAPRGARDGAPLPARRAAEPAATGAVPAAVCRLSGLRPGRMCPVTPEWFAPGTVPTDSCTWHDDEGGRQPPRRLCRMGRAVRPAPGRSRRPTQCGAVACPEPGFHIVSPREGDVYRLSPGVDPRYSTVALRAAGGRDAAKVRWSVDDVPHAGGRWTLRPGRHRVRALSAAGDSAEVAVRVE